MPSRTIPLDLPQTLAELDRRLTTVEKALAKLKHDAPKPVAKPKSVEPDKPKPVAGLYDKARAFLADEPLETTKPVDSTISSRPVPPKSGGPVEYTARQPSERFEPIAPPSEQVSPRWA